MTGPMTDKPDGRRWGTWVLLTILTLLVTSPILTFFFGAWLLVFFETPMHRRGVTNPAADFSSISGLPWPASAKVVAARDTHWDRKGGPLFEVGPGMFDGNLQIVFDTKPAILKEWLSQRAPWGQNWKDGRVPDVIAQRARLDNHQSTRIKYAVHERGTALRQPGFEFWHGELIVLDTESGRVSLFKWDGP